MTRLLFCAYDVSTFFNVLLISFSPYNTGGLDVYYPNYNLKWNEGHCINTRQGIILNKDGTPRDRPSYSSMLECCKNAYAGQMSGKCISMLPEEIRPTNHQLMQNVLLTFGTPCMKCHGVNPVVRISYRCHIIM